MLATYARERQQQQPPSQIQNTTLVPCRSDEFHCSELNTLKCTQKSYVCDVNNDCGSKQDDRNCAESCGSKRLARMNATEIAICISNQAVYDGDKDCGDFSDEINCKNYSDHTEN